MVDQQIDKIEVKRNFLLADDARVLFEKSDLTEESLFTDYYRLSDILWTINETDLDKRIADADKTRLKRYNNPNLEWYSGQVSLDKMGSWPIMDEFPIKLTTGNIVETGQRIFSLKEDERDNNIKRFFDKYKSIVKWKDSIIEKFPLILLPKGIVREDDYNTWARKSRQPLCNIFDYDIDAGNSRALSYTLEGLTEAPCLYPVEK